MSQAERIEISDFVRAQPAPIADRRLVIAAALLVVALALIAAQFVFVGNNYGALDAAAGTAAFGIIAP